MDDEAGQLILSPQPPDEKKLSKVLRTYELALRTEHSKNEALCAEREYLVQLIELRNEQWTRHVSLLESRIEQMKVQEVKMQKYYTTKLEFLVDTKEKKASSYKEYAELAEKDLEDAHTCIAALGAENKALKSKLNNVENIPPVGMFNNTELKDLQLKNTKLKQMYKSLKSEKKAQLSEKESQIEALVAEKDFVWNQFKAMESEYVSALKSKNSELNKSNEAVNMLKENLEKMEASILEKDSAISKIKEEMMASISKMKEEMMASISKKDDLISRLNGEVENLRKMLNEKNQMISGMRADVPKYAARTATVCKPVDSGTSRALRSGAKRTRESVSWCQPPASHSVSGQRQHSNKSRGNTSASTAETALLFSSSFKVPKLKITTTPSVNATNMLAK